MLKKLELNMTFNSEFIVCLASIEGWLIKYWSERISEFVE